MNQSKADKAFTELKKLILDRFNGINERLDNVETIAENTDVKLKHKAS